MTNNERSRRYNTVAESLSREFPEFGRVILNLGAPYFTNSGIPTAGVVKNLITRDIEYHWNPDFFDTLSDPEVAFIHMHEAMHMFLDHLSPIYDNANSREILNYAFDAVVNDILIKNFGDNPIVSMREDLVTGMKVLGEDCSNKTADYVYRKLCKKAKVRPYSKKKKKGKKDQNQQGQGQSGDGQPGDQQGQGQPGDGQSSQSDQQGQSGNQQSPNPGSSGNDDGTDGLKDPKETYDESKAGQDKTGQDQNGQSGQDKTGRTSESSGTHTWDGITRDDIEPFIGGNTLFDPKTGKIVKGYSGRGSGAGNTDLFYATREANFSLWHLIKHFIGKREEIEIVDHWRRTSSKLAHCYPDVILPYETLDENRSKLKILFSIDSSGSISDGLLEEFVNIARFHEKDIHEIHAISFDWEVYKLNLKSGKVTGRGGTSFENMVKYVHDSKENYDAVFVLTDGDGGAFDPKLVDAQKWFWIITPGGHKVAESCGRSIEIPRSYLSKRGW